MIYEQLSYKIIGCCINVHKVLGGGLLEQCYHNALYYELIETGIMAKYNESFNVMYRDKIVGEYFADLVVENKIIIELKSVKVLVDIHAAQLLNYLHISGCKLGFLINFQGQKLEWQRLVIE
ncbi:MAG: GxxExxY protein [Spirochaetales bacterium]|nr:GxxExxY protein [Spirochaetales bacterium]